MAIIGKGAIAKEQHFFRSSDGYYNIVMERDGCVEVWQSKDCKEWTSRDSGQELYAEIKLDKDMIHIKYYDAAEVIGVTIDGDGAVEDVPKAQIVNSDAEIDLKDSVLDIESPLYVVQGNISRTPWLNNRIGPPWVEE